MFRDILKKFRFRPDKGSSELGTAAKLSFSDHKCPKCGHDITADEELEYLDVCPYCGYHERLSARRRIAFTVDPGSFRELFGQITTANPLDIPEYDEKLERQRKKTGIDEAVITGAAEIKGQKCLIGVMDSFFFMGSMGSAVGEKLARLFEYGIREELPVIIFTASGGARMQEGVLSLMQMAKVSAAAKLHSEMDLLYITVLTDPTTGGVTASFGMLGDYILAEPGALIGFAGRRVIEGTIQGSLPEDFQSAEFQAEHGFVDRIVPRGEMRELLSRLIKYNRPVITKRWMLKNFISFWDKDKDKERSYE